MTNVFDTSKEPMRKEGALAPLFDRLVEENGPAEGRYYTKEDILASIEREVFRILNTRANAKAKDYEAFQKTDYGLTLPQMYGLAPFEGLSISNRTDWRKICRLCETAIQAFEPRLKNVHVTVTEYDKSEQKLILAITGRAIVDKFNEEVTFPLSFSVPS